MMMMKMFSSIRVKLTLWYIGTIGILILIFGSILYLSLKKSLERGIDLSLRTFEEELRDALQANPYEKWNDVVGKESKEEIPINMMYVQIMRIPANGNKPTVSIKSKTLKDRDLPLSEKAYAKVMRGEISFETLKDEDNFPLRIMTSPVEDKGALSFILQLAIPLKEVANISNKLLVILLISGPILLLLSAFGGYLFVKKAFSPVKKIVRTAKRITAENLSHRLEPIDSKDEIGELAETFNDMIFRLEWSFKQIKQFSSDVSHELKTPLTAIRGEIEVTLRREREIEEYKDILKSLLEETGKLERIVKNMLFLSRIDSQGMKFSFRRFALDEILLEAFEKIEKVAERKNVHLILRKIQPVNIKGESNQVKRAITNLIDNAIKYTPEGGKIEMSLEKERDSAKFTIRDTGMGIPEDAIPYIFDRFYRVDKARSRETGGSGLGLAIVKWIIEAHKGNIEVKSKIGEGSIFIVFLPLKH